MLRLIPRASAPQVGRHAFHSIVQRAFARHPGLQALSWDRRVPDALRIEDEAAPASQRVLYDSRKGAPGGPGPVRAEAPEQGLAGMRWAPPWS
jgi:hypothetical protein